jgi:hypothetical protein
VLKLRENFQWPYQAQSISDKGVSEAAPLPFDRKNDGSVPWLRHRPHHAIKAWRSGFSVEYAVADCGSGEGEGQN